MRAELPLSTETILDTAEQVLRRYGPNKTTVVDVARALDVSHGTIYKYFASKASLREAVVERWLQRLSAPLEALIDHTGSAPQRLRLWFDTLIHSKRAKMLEDPELFSMYITLTEEAVEAVTAHVSDLIAQITRIIEYGISTQEFKSGDARNIAVAVFMATVRFHHPAHANEWTSSGIDQEFDCVWDLILSGIVQPQRVDV
jgi:AcrR family transcriptional regulator